MPRKRYECRPGRDRSGKHGFSAPAEGPIIDPLGQLLIYVHIKIRYRLLGGELNSPTNQRSCSPSFALLELFQLINQEILSKFNETFRLGRLG